MNLDRKKSGRTQCVLIISDTHGAVAPRVLVVTRECEATVRAGDIAGEHVLYDLFEHGYPVDALRGNNDRSERREQAWALTTMHSVRGVGLRC